MTIPKKTAQYLESYMSWVKHCKEGTWKDNYPAYEKLLELGNPIPAYNAQLKHTRPKQYWEPMFWPLILWERGTWQAGYEEVAAVYAIEANPGAVSDYLEGKDKAINACMGWIMKNEPCIEPSDVMGAIKDILSSAHPLSSK